VRVQCTVVPQYSAHRTEYPLPTWPEGWPPPRKGDEVCLADGTITLVHVVEWLPHGEDGGDPFVYVVLRTPSPLVGRDG